MIPAKSLPPGEPIFTHVLPSGENIHIHAHGLRTWLLKHWKSEPLLIPLDTQLASSFIRDNVVDPLRVVKLIRRHATWTALNHMEPIVLCVDGEMTDGRPDVFFVDGHHRYVMCVALRRSFIRTHIVPPEVWKNFLISGLGSLTHQELRDLPITTRNY